MPPRRPPRTSVPTFALYGEPGAPAADLLHVESVQSRARLYRWEIEPHVHAGLHQLIWLRAGAVEVTLDGTRERCSGPALLVIPPGTVHGFRFAAESDGHVLTLSPRSVVEGDLAAAGDALRALFARARAMPVPAVEVVRVGALFDTLAAEFAAPGSAGSPVPLWLARALVWRLAQIGARDDLAAGGAQARGLQSLFTRFLVLVESHYAEHWPISRYASQLGLSTARLNRLVRAQANTSALELVHERLAREACRRLVYIEAPISRLAFELGFEDPAYFCRFFARRTGQSPSEYRRRQASGAPT